MSLECDDEQFALCWMEVCVLEAFGMKADMDLLKKKMQKCSSTSPIWRKE